MRSRITLAVLVAVLVVGALVVSPLFAGAQTPVPTTPAEEGPRRDLADAFLETFAEELGVSTEEVDAAFDAAVTEQLDSAVADGDLSQEQADRLAERLADRDLAELLGGFGRFGGRGEHGSGRGFGGRFGGPWSRLGDEFGIGRDAEEVTGDAAEQASEAALTAVGDGEVLKVVRSDAEGAEYFVAVRNAEGLSGVLLDSDFEVLRTQQWNREGEDEGREDRDTSEPESDAA